MYRMVQARARQKLLNPCPRGVTIQCQETESMQVALVEAKLVKSQSWYQAIWGWGPGGRY